MPLCRHLIAFLVLIGFLAIGGRAGAGEVLPPILSAPEVRQMQIEGRILLVDIRSPREWHKTGIAADALAITLHRRDFAGALLVAAGGDHARPIAIICATGGRTALARRYLERMGFTAVVDVSEGMLGNSRGPGWIRRGLPVVAYRGEQGQPLSARPSPPG
jgi:rhodanese-related sulfurtransferase